ncbi:hypothetical protein [Oceanobacillus sp. CAU 1775]
MLNLTVEELIEINDFFNSSSEISIVYITGDLVLLELYDNGQIDEFIISQRDLIMVLRNFYVEDICDIVHLGVNGCIRVRVDETVKHYPVEITAEDGYKYYCNLQELNYIKRLINRQKDI